MPALYPSKEMSTPVSKGLHPAICCEFLDLGIVDTRYGKKHKGAWVFQVDERDDEGKRKEIRCKFNLAVGTPTKPSKVQKLMGKWRGASYSQAELDNGDIDPEKPVGQPCILDVEHATLDDGTLIHYVDSILPAGEVRLEPVGYVPVAERAQTKTKGGNGRDGGGDEPHEEISGARNDEPPF